MPKTVTVTFLISMVAMLTAVGVASTNSAIAGSGFGPPSGAIPTFGVKICHGADLNSNELAAVDSLAQMLMDSSGGRFGVVDTYDIGATHGQSAFPATDWYNLGYHAILTFTIQPPQDSLALGDSLARFIQLGGGVVAATFSENPGSAIKGSWHFLYEPFTELPYTVDSGSMGTVYQPLHPVMAGVSNLHVSLFHTNNTSSSLRSLNCVSLAEWTVSSYCLAACFDSAGQRAVSLGMVPLCVWQGRTATGQWCRLIVNALDWVANGPSVGVTAPNGGENWAGGSVHNITWTQTSNGVKDSIYYSSDGGTSWTGVAYFASPPAPLQYAWTVPNTPTTQARVKVVTWDANGGRVEDVSDANFTIAAPGIAQPEGGALPLAFALHQPFPNPLASGAQIRYALPRSAHVDLRIYDVAGTLVRRLVDGGQSAGNQSAYWNGLDDRGRRVAPGVYYCRFKAGDFTAAQKLVVRR